MANIGDIYFTFRGDGARLTADAQAAGAKAGAVGGMSFGQNLKTSFKKSFSGAEIGKGLVQGLGFAGALGAANLTRMGISKVVDVLGDATRAALEDQASQQKLGTSLKANIPNWDGNTAAIEKVLTARIDLGFSDDEQRDSLARLVIATHDVTKALAVQRTAMDLARLKGISLADATDALTRVEGGQFRLLKGLGIQLKKGATATDALAAVQKAATGQAEDYAKTNSGKLLVAQTKVNEALEKLGYVIMPAVAGAMSSVADVITNISTAFGVLDDAVKSVSGSGDGLAEVWSGVVNAFAPTLPIIDSLKAKQKELNSTFRDGFPSAVRMGTGVEEGYSTAEGAATDAEHGIATANRRIANSFSNMVKSLSDEASTLIDEVYDPVIQHNELAANAEEQAALRRIIASKKSTDAEITDSRRRLVELSKNADETRLRLLTSGNLTAAETKAWLGELQKKYKTSTGDARVKIGALIDKIKELSKLSSGSVDIKVQATVKASKPGLGGGGGVVSGGKLASGGPVTKGKPYVVGEKRPELFVPDDRQVAVPGSRLAKRKAELLSGTLGPVERKVWVRELREQAAIATEPHKTKIITLIKRIEELSVLPIRKVRPETRRVLGTVVQMVDKLGPRPRIVGKDGPEIIVAEVPGRIIPRVPPGFEEHEREDRGVVARPKPPGFGRIQTREAGGSVEAGSPYRVGERRPELFVPKVVSRPGSQLRAPRPWTPTHAATVASTRLTQPAGDTHFNLTVQGDLQARDKPDVLATMQRLRSISSRSFSGVK